MDPRPDSRACETRGDELSALTLRPGLIEVSGRRSPARMSAAAALVRGAQVAGETTAWIQPRSGGLFPPDLAAAGVDLDALVVIHAEPERGTPALLQAAEWLLHSGAFGLLVVDLGTDRPPRGNAWQARLGALTREHASCVVLITTTDDHEGSLGPFVGLRLAPRRGRTLEGLCPVDIPVLKNKHGNSLSVRPASWRTPPGL